MSERERIVAELKGKHLEDMPDFILSKLAEERGRILALVEQKQGVEARCQLESMLEKV